MDPLNREFVELLNASGWTSAEAARQLEVTPGLISQYRSGSTRPSPQMLRLFKLVLVGENPAALQAAGSSVPNYPEHKNEFGEMNDQLIELKKADPKAFATVKTMIESVTAQAKAKAAERKEPAPVKVAKLVIDSMHRTATANSAEAVALGAASELTVAGVPHPPATPLPKRAVPAPSAHTPPPAAPAPSRRGGRRAAPRPAPTAPES